MPNYCNDLLRVSGLPSALLDFIDRARGTEPVYKLCKTQLTKTLTNEIDNTTVEGPQPIIPLNFHSLVPVPTELLAKTYGGEEERAANGKPRNTFSTDEIDCGYLWEHANWGCKWGAQNTLIVEQSANSIVYDFETAWSPPDNFVITASLLFPTLLFRLAFREPNEDFKGFILVQRGNVIERAVAVCQAVYPQPTIKDAEIALSTGAEITLYEDYEPMPDLFADNQQHNTITVRQLDNSSLLLKATFHGEIVEQVLDASSGVGAICEKIMDDPLKYAP